MEFLRGRWNPFAGFALLLMLLAACSGSEGTTDEPNAVGTSTDGGSTAAETETEMATPAAQSGGSVTIGALGEMQTFDPAQQATLGAQSWPLVAVYDTLLRLDENGQVISNLAEMTTEDDGMTWTLSMAPGVTFSDGSSFDAEAVEANILRHQDPATASRSAAALGAISSLEVVDEQTVRMELAEPNVAFDYVFANQPAALIVSPAAFEPGHDLETNPIGAGPFTVESWQRDNQMVLERNEEYWKPEAPRADELVIRPIPDTTTRYSSVQSGDVDLAYFLDYDSLANAEEDGLTAVSRLGNGGQIYVLNTSQAPLDDERVRTALAMAMDRPAINEVGYAGEESVANGPFTPESPYYVEDNGYPAYDPEAAQALIEEYEGETGQQVEFTLTIPNFPDRVQVAELQQEMWSQAGIDVELQIVETAELVARLTDGNFEAINRTIEDFADPEPTLTRHFYSNSPTNISRFDSESLDDAFDRGRSTSDEQDRAEAYQEAARILGTEIPALWWAHGISGIVHGSGVALGDYHGESVLWFDGLTRME